MFSKGTLVRFSGYFTGKRREFAHVISVRMVMNEFADKSFMGSNVASLEQYLQSTERVKSQSLLIKGKQIHCRTKPMFSNYCQVVEKGRGDRSIRYARANGHPVTC